MKLSFFLLLFWCLVLWEVMGCRTMQVKATCANSAWIEGSASSLFSEATFTVDDLCNKASGTYGAKTDGQAIQMSAGALGALLGAAVKSGAGVP